MTDDELEDYLANWGRWCRATHSPGRSPLARLMVEAGSMSADPGPAPVDLERALLVNRAWQAMPAVTYSDRCVKALTVALYAFPVSRDHMLFLIRRYYGLRIRYRDVDNFLARGRTLLRNRLEKILWAPL